MQGRVGSPMVILDTVSSRVELRAFRVFRGVCSIASVSLRGGWEIISTIKVWRRGITCRWSRIRHPTPVSILFVSKLGFVFGMLLSGSVCGILRIFLPPYAPSPAE